MEHTNNQHDELGLAAFMGALEERGLTFEHLDDSAIVVAIEEPYPLVTTTIQAFDRRAVFDTIYPFKAPAQQRSRTMELVVRLNCRTDVGALTLDPEDGELGFRTWLPISGEYLTVHNASSALREHWAEANRLLPAIAVVVFTDLSLVSAIAQSKGTTPLDEVVRLAIRRLDADGEG